MNVILSYPRSGNHLTRFFIELLSEKPTFGCECNKFDVPIYQNKFENELPFNININTLSDSDKKECYYKFHQQPNECSKLIFILRNPQEVLLRYCNYIMDLNSFDSYFKSIDYYHNFNENNKIMFFYEDIIINRIEFINKLYNFLKCNNKKKLEWVINNIDFLYNESSNGKGRSWGGINSNSINYYYPKITLKTKAKFDKYLSNKLNNPNYLFIKEKYNISFI
jgi:hypothetical protein